MHSTNVLLAATALYTKILKCLTTLSFGHMVETTSMDVTEG